MANSDLRARLLKGHVIPAHPLALTEDRLLDERHQRALTRYYKDAGAGGVAVGVHTTQFAIRQIPGLYSKVLALASEEAPGLIKIAGICGGTAQAIQEARVARELGYEAGLLSLSAAPADLIGHAREVAQHIPLFGFYLQPSVGGRILPYEFWRRFFDIPEVVAVKVAPFNRYQTIDVTRALKASGRAHEIALYTGNDDAIVHDLETDFDGLRFVGGLLGHWSVWTHKAIDTLKSRQHAYAITDANAALFDAANGFKGCIAGLHEILRRQGLLKGRWCLDPHEDLSLGQLEEIDRVHAAYPFLNDDKFVEANIERWLG